MFFVMRAKLDVKNMLYLTKILNMNFSKWSAYTCEQVHRNTHWSYLWDTDFQKSPWLCYRQVH